MSDYEALALVGMHVEQLEAAFEFWLTISFGVLAAVYITRTSMTRQLKILLCVLYVSASLIAIFHTIGDMVQGSEYLEVVLRTSDAQIWDRMGGVLRMIVYLVGTVSVAVTIFRYDSSEKNNT